MVESSSFSVPAAGRTAALLAGVDFQVVHSLVSIAQVLELIGFVPLPVGWTISGAGSNKVDAPTSATA
jgi:hypothetical protein